MPRQKLATPRPENAAGGEQSRRLHVGGDEAHATDVLPEAVDDGALAVGQGEHLGVEAVIGPEDPGMPGVAGRGEPGAQVAVEVEIGDRRIAGRRIGRATCPRRARRRRRARSLPSSRRRHDHGGADPQERRMPRSNSSCSTMVAIGAPMPKAVAVMRAPAAAAGDRPQTAVLGKDARRIEMVGNSVDAGAIADQDRRLADLVLRAADVPGAACRVAFAHRFGPVHRDNSNCRAAAMPARTASGGSAAPPASAATRPPTNVSPAPVGSPAATGSPAISALRPAHVDAHPRRPPRLDENAPRPRRHRQGRLEKHSLALAEGDDFGPLGNLALEFGGDGARVGLHRPHEACGVLEDRQYGPAHVGGPTVRQTQSAAATRAAWASDRLGSPSSPASKRQTQPPSGW